MDVQLNQQQLKQAVFNNAQWCNAVCRAHGSAGEFRESIWLHPGKVPPFYPNLITLDAKSADTQLAVLQAMAADGLPSGWAVKDSFAALDLEPQGFLNVAEAQWICRTGLSSPEFDLSGLTSDLVKTSEELIEWESAWRGVPKEQVIESVIFPPALLDDQNIVFIRVHKEGQLIAGAIANQTDQVVGLSNLFAAEESQASYWAIIVSAIEEQFPSLPIVGYEADDELEIAQSLGFETLGPLRVWIKG